MGDTRRGAWERGAPCVFTLASRLPLRRNVDGDKVPFGNHRHAKMRLITFCRTTCTAQYIGYL